MPLLDTNLELDRCPHCQVSHPNLIYCWGVGTTDSAGRRARHWNAYKCTACGGIVCATAASQGGIVVQYFPSLETVDDALPPRAKEYLRQAMESAPAGAVMCAASAVDAMLKDKGYKKGSLYERIDASAKDHVITEEMAKWAHAVRLDANDQRHDDESTSIASQEDGERAIAFTKALGQFMFVIPALVAKGISEAEQGQVAE